MRRALSALLCSALSLQGCEPLVSYPAEARSEAPIFRAARLSSAIPIGYPRSLRVMSWNIKFAAARAPFWFDCWGDRVQLGAEEVDQNLQDIYAMIREARPDILLVQELDLHSRRSGYRDMMQGILDNSSLNYGAYFSSWESRYIPSEGLGRVAMGNAIFSRFPIEGATRIALEERSDLDFLTSRFYLRRSLGRAELSIGEQRVSVYVLHSEAYDQDGTKQRQLEQVFEEVQREARPFILGGDFNELPPSALRVAQFPDERRSNVCGEDFEQPPYTPEKMRPFYEQLVPWIDLQRYGASFAEQARFYTHSTLGPDEQNELGEPGDWNRTLDYLFASPETYWREGSADVLQRSGQQVGTLSWRLKGDPLRLSDHAPVFGIWVL